MIKIKRPNMSLTKKPKFCRLKIKLINKDWNQQRKYKIIFKNIFQGVN
jgi:hypothetical protein